MFGSTQVLHLPFECHRILEFLKLKFIKKICLHLFTLLFVFVYLYEGLSALQFFCLALVFLLMKVYDSKTY